MHSQPSDLRVQTLPADVPLHEVLAQPPHQKVFVCSKALLGAIRAEPEKKLDLSVQDEACGLLGGLISGLLDSSAHQARARAPDDKPNDVPIPDVRAATQEMGLGEPG